MGRMIGAHRIRTRPSPQRVRIERDGVVLAESDRALLLEEGRLPVRIYVPPEDVRFEHLEPSATTSRCPFKGRASYWSVRGGPADVAWSYQDPIDSVSEIRGLVAFYDDRVDVTRT